MSRGRVSAVVALIASARWWVFGVGAVLTIFGPGSDEASWRSAVSMTVVFFFIVPRMAQTVSAFVEGYRDDGQGAT